MIRFPNAKINLGLNIVGKRDDGYHDLETVFYPLGLKDALEILPAEDGASAPEGVELHLSGLQVDGPSSENICVKAWRLLKRDFPGLPSIRLFLHKSIPMGAGLGGGSSDGAFALEMIAAEFSLPIDRERLAAYSLRLGSDCPFFLLNRPAYGTGRGERLVPVPLDLSEYRILLVHPGIHVSTAQAFSGVIPSQPELNVRDIVSQPVDNWKGLLFNDFERTVFVAHPEIADIKQNLYEAGAVFASMSGSGSSVFGLFPKGKEPSIPFPTRYFTRWAEAPPTFR
jgi:4-diphosphocytidyl-2-C-methyl-D-erythritol kinase